MPTTPEQASADMLHALDRLKSTARVRAIITDIRERQPEPQPEVRPRPLSHARFMGVSDGSGH